MFYSASFPVTMELMDSKVADILGFIGMEKDFEAFSKFSVFSKNIIKKIIQILDLFLVQKRIGSKIDMKKINLIAI